MEEIRVLLVARRSAREQRIQTLNQLRHLVFTAPEPIRARFKDRYKTGLVTDVAKLRPRKDSDPISYTTQVTMRGLARRIRHLDAEMKMIDTRLKQLITNAAPSLLELHGVGLDTAASLLVTAGDNPDRLRSRSLMGTPVRRHTDPCIIRPDHQAPPQPGRRPSRQHSPLPHRVDPHEQRPENP